MTSEEISRFTSRGFNISESNGYINVLNKTKQVYNYTGTDQFFEVPVNVSHIFVKMWGAGGAAGLRGGWLVGGLGGGGGFSAGLIQTIYGETLTIKVGCGGFTNQFGINYGGGAGIPPGATTDARYCGQGGGGTYIFRNSSTPLLIAGGGGSGGTTANTAGFMFNHGGSGGGLVGGKGYGTQTFSGNGGTQTSGGAATPTAAYSTGEAGSLYQGGRSGVYVSVNGSYGGGGGGGYYGGSGGSYTSDNNMGGGGGGSGFVAPYLIYGFTETGDVQLPPYRFDSDFPQGYTGGNSFIAHGGVETGVTSASIAQSGGHGLCVIYY